MAAVLLTGHAPPQPTPEAIRIEAARYRAQIANFAFLVKTKGHPARTQRAFAQLDNQLHRYFAVKLAAGEARIGGHDA